MASTAVSTVAKAVIINVDNNSPDGTRDAFMETPTKVPKIYISTPEGVKGKGNNVRNLFKAAVELNAQAVAMVADMAYPSSISPRLTRLRFSTEPPVGRTSIRRSGTSRLK